MTRFIISSATLVVALAAGCTRTSSEQPPRNDIVAPASPELARERRVVLDVYAHVFVLQQNDLPFVGYRDVLAVAKAIDPEVVAAAPFVVATAELSVGGKPAAPILVKGVAPERTVLRTNLEKYLDRGDEVLGIEIELAHENEAPHVAKKLNERLAPPLQAVDWCKSNFKNLRC